METEKRGEKKSEEEKQQRREAKARRGGYGICTPVPTVGSLQIIRRIIICGIRIGNGDCSVNEYER